MNVERLDTTAAAAAATATASTRRTSAHIAAAAAVDVAVVSAINDAARLNVHVDVDLCELMMLLFLLLLLLMLLMLVVEREGRVACVRVADQLEYVDEAGVLSSEQRRLTLLLIDIGEIEQRAGGGLLIC